MISKHVGPAQPLAGPGTITYILGFPEPLLIALYFVDFY